LLFATQYVEHKKKRKKNLNMKKILNQ